MIMQICHSTDPFCDNLLNNSISIINIQQPGKG